jgi:EAL domain-containing protein (putative c-di-GMP-specific phosphodiesterase class I)
VQPTARVGQAFLSLNPFYRFERRVYAAIDDARNSVGRRERRRERSWGEELAEIIRKADVRAYLQPVVRLSSRDIIGFEALVRGPSQSMFEAPQAMFALSARVGSDAELDRVCLAEALRASATADWSGRLFVNLLPGSFAAGNGAVSAFRDRVHAAGFDPGDVVIEFSERRGDEDREGLVAAMGAAREGGFDVALDDAGTGRNSRELVEATRPSYVKLDVSLVRDVHTNLIKQEVLHSLVRIAGEVGADVIAEGVEHEAEAETLERAGAGFAQGFLFAVPAPAATVLRRAPKASR